MSSNPRKRKLSSPDTTVENIHKKARLNSNKPLRIQLNAPPRPPIQSIDSGSSLETHSGGQQSNQKRIALSKASNNRMNFEVRSNARRNTRRTKKKLKIEPFKKPPKLAESFEEDTVNKLIQAVQAVHGKKAANCRLEELYKACQSMCNLKKGRLVYERLYESCDKHIALMVTTMVDISVTHPSSFLEPLRKIWEDHREEMHAIRQIFLTLDRTYVRQHTDVKSLWAMGIRLLKHHISAKDNCQQFMVAHVLKLIECERNGEEIDRTLLKAIIKMIAHIDIYKCSFEPNLLKHSNSYYQNEGNKLIQSMSIPDYLTHVMKRLSEEHNRVQSYLDHRTQRPLALVIEQQMIKLHVNVLLSKGFDSMMDESRFTDLRHLYGLLQSVHKLQPLQQAFLNYIKMRGLTMVNDKGKDTELVQHLLVYKSKLDRVMRESFHSNRDFNNVIRKSWENFLNVRKNKPAELIAKFIDHQLRTGARGTSEQELEDSLDRVMDIFRFIHGKDVFQAFYKKDLAKRLLLRTSASEDAERGMINRIRKECGQQYASHLENMFQDIDISRDLMDKFKTHVSHNRQVQSQVQSMDLDIEVLTSGFWPSYDTDAIALPSQIQTILDNYRKFYLNINSGRKLLWTASLSHCIIGANFPKGRKELILSAFQATVILLFNQKIKWTFKDIQQSTQIKADELKRTLLSLVRARILLHRQNSSDDTDAEYKVNAKYENRLIRVKVNQIQVSETKEEHEKTTTRIFTDRQYQIDACIVRVMKARKTLTHQQLMSECLKQLRFDAQPRQIKKRIETLIDNEYLERDKDNKSIYHYKA